MYYRENQGPPVANYFQQPQPVAEQNLALTPYQTAPEPYQDPNQRLAESFQQFHIGPGYDPSVPNSNSYLNPNSYPGDLALPADFVPADFDGTERAFAVPKIKLGKPRIPTANEIKKALKPVGDLITGAIALPIAYPVLALVPPYIEGLRAQINDGRAKHLPQWLKSALGTRYPTINMSKIRYGEHVRIPTPGNGFAMTIGYNIYLPGKINLDQNTVINDLDQAQDFALNLQLIMHEMEHIVQFVHGGGDEYTWAAKYVFNVAVSLKGSVSKWHDNIQLEKDADAKAWGLVNYAMDTFSRLQKTVKKWPQTGNRIRLDRTTVAEADARTNFAGIWLQSRNKQWEFYINAYGNMVVYGPGRVVAWESKTVGKASPPYWLAVTPGHDQIVFGGWHFHKNPRANQIVPDQVTTWLTAKYVPPFGLTGSTAASFAPPQAAYTPDVHHASFGYNGVPAQAAPLQTINNNPPSYSSPVPSYANTTRSLEVSYNDTNNYGYSDPPHANPPEPSYDSPSYTDSSVTRSNPYVEPSASYADESNRYNFNDPPHANLSDPSYNSPSSNDRSVTHADHSYDSASYTDGSVTHADHSYSSPSYTDGSVTRSDPYADESNRYGHNDPPYANPSDPSYDSASYTDSSVTRSSPYVEHSASYVHETDRNNANVSYNGPVLEPEHSYTDHSTSRANPYAEPSLSYSDNNANNETSRANPYMSPPLSYASPQQSYANPPSSHTSPQQSYANPSPSYHSPQQPIPSHNTASYLSPSHPSAQPPPSYVSDGPGASYASPVPSQNSTLPTNPPHIPPGPSYSNKAFIDPSTYVVPTENGNSFTNPPWPDAPAAYDYYNANANVQAQPPTNLSYSHPSNANPPNTYASSPPPVSFNNNVPNQSLYTTSQPPPPQQYNFISPAPPPPPQQQSFTSSPPPQQPNFLIGPTQPYIDPPSCEVHLELSDHGQLLVILVSKTAVLASLNPANTNPSNPATSNLWGGLGGVKLPGNIPGIVRHPVKTTETVIWRSALPKPSSVNTSGITTSVLVPQTVMLPAAHPR